MKWIIKSKHLNEDKKIIGLEVEDADGTFDANIRWDGLMEINIQSITEEGNRLNDKIHTYDIDGLITKLEGLRHVCSDFFDDWKKEQ